MTHLSLFSGIGGLDLAAEMAGFKTVGQCEWADYPTKVLEKHWPDVPRWRDIRTLTGESFYERTGLRTVDIISGGFPCQPFSVAGKRRGQEDDRYLWPEMCRVIKELRPCWVIGENVAGIVTMALDQVLTDLEAIGYAAMAFIIPACAVDAPHRRDRCAIVAYTNGERRHRGESCTGQTGRDGYSDLCINVSDADDRGRAMRWKWELRPASEAEGEGADHGRGTPQYVPGEWWPAEPDVGRSIDGFSGWMDSFGGLTDGAKARGTEILRNMRKEYVEETIQRTAGRFYGVSKEEVLLAILCEYEERSHGGRNALESGEAEGQLLRDLWRTIEAARSPHRREYKKQFAREYSDALHQLSHGAPSLIPQAWANGSWEDGLQRVVTGIPARVDRLKCLGNAVVPQQFYPVFAAILEIEGREQ